MRRALTVFETVLQDTEQAHIIYTYLDKVVKAPIDYSDLLRWQWVQSVSALDKLIHDLVRLGMLEIFQSRRSLTPKFASFAIDINFHMQLVAAPTSAINLFESQILKKHSFLSFQDPDKISDALSNIWDEPHKWKCISAKMQLEESRVKTQLKNIVIRRNQIAHAGDYPNLMLERQEIEPNDVKDVVDFIKNLGENIYELVKI